MTTLTQPASAAELLRTVRQRISQRWTAGQATDVLLDLNSPHCATACMLFTRATGVKIALFENRQPSHKVMLASLDAAILLAEREMVA